MNKALEQFWEWKDPQKLHKDNPFKEIK